MQADKATNDYLLGLVLRHCIKTSKLQLDVLDVYELTRLDSGRRCAIFGYFFKWAAWGKSHMAP